MRRRSATRHSTTHVTKTGWGPPQLPCVRVLRADAMQSVLPSPPGDSLQDTQTTTRVQAAKTNGCPKGLPLLETVSTPRTAQHDARMRRLAMSIPRHRSGGHRGVNPVLCLAGAWRASLRAFLAPRLRRSWVAGTCRRASCFYIQLHPITSL